MEQIEKKVYLANLYEYYSLLLTDKQKDIFKSYYLLDYSLGEISTELGVSRNAIHDTLKNVEKSLIEYEEKLKLFEKAVKKEELYKKYESSDTKELIEKLKEID